MPKQLGDSLEIWTIGHSNLSADEFLERLKFQSIAAIADVRRFPGSRKHPHFGRDLLEAHLASQGIAYEHIEALGGRRSARLKDSPNRGWRVEAFNAFADYMLSPGFRAALDHLTGAAAARRTAVLCSEALPWRCHRRLIADALITRDWTVWDIIGKQARKHVLTDFAVVRDGQLAYPGVELS